MSNIPNKIYHLLGYNNLAIILDQDRKHWLMKTDKKKQLMDSATGDIFQGQIDNIGSDIILSTEKLVNNFANLVGISFTNVEAAKALSLEPSAFTHSMEVNGLSFMRIMSSRYQYNTPDTDTLTYKHYKIRFNDCVECVIPFGSDDSSEYIFADKWIKTSTTPTILMMNDDGEYTIEIPLSLTGASNTVFYYPLNENLQPLPITDEGEGVYMMGDVDSDDYIGFPLMWFTCDETNIGPSYSVTNNTSQNGLQLSYITNKGNVSKYDATIIFGVDGFNNATPDDSATSSYKITCSPIDGVEFNLSGNNSEIYINPESICLVNIDNDTVYPMGITLGDTGSIITACQNDAWVVDSPTSMSIPLSTFDSNCVNVTHESLIPAFNVHFDTSIPFSNTDEKNVGYAGVRMGSSNISSDIYERYPYELNKWDGLPTWMNNLDENMVPQHAVMYAIRNTPNYVPGTPDSRQVAALILDPGLQKTDNEEFTADEKGRVYVISNDDTEYRNNGSEKNRDSSYVKPDRTAARICDIPVSVMQLTGISGLAPTSVVDKKYVRSEASFTEEDKDRLYNGLADKWVRPSALDNNGYPISNRESQAGDNYVFNSLELLNTVSLTLYNDFCEIINLNSYVSPDKVHVSSITSGGSGYHIGDTGKIIVGGFSFSYEVLNVNNEDAGVVTEVGIGFDNDVDINISNFDMTDGSSGVSNDYGTSPNDPTHSGTGLIIRFYIDDYVSLLPRKGKIFDDLFAFVRHNDGLWLYEILVRYTAGGDLESSEWVKKILVSPFEDSTTNKDTGNLSMTDAYMSTIIPLYKQIAVSTKDEGKGTVLIDTFKTPSMINIVDEKCTPLTPSSQSSVDVSKLTQVDINKWRCDGILTTNAPTKNFTGVLKALQDLNVLRYDSYVIWKFTSSNPSITSFQYGIIYRSLNNYLTSDSTGMLPVNELKYQNYVHSNANTIVTWNPKGGTGPMVWVYNPESIIHEKYQVNPSTQELEVVRDYNTWNDVEFPDGSHPSMVDSTGHLAWNIMTNNPGDLTSTETTSSIIYADKEFVQNRSLLIGSDIGVANNLMRGMWSLIFPKITSYRIANITTGEEFTPVKMQVIHGEDLKTIGDVVDRNGGRVNIRTLIVNENSDGVSMKTYNEKTENWESIV